MLVGNLRVAETLLEVIDTIGRNIIGVRGKESSVFSRGENRSERGLGVCKGLLEEWFGARIRRISMGYRR